MYRQRRGWGKSPQDFLEEEKLAKKIEGSQQTEESKERFIMKAKEARFKKEEVSVRSAVGRLCCEDSGVAIRVGNVKITCVLD